MRHHQITASLLYFSHSVQAPPLTGGNLSLGVHAERAEECRCAGRFWASGSHVHADVGSRGPSWDSGAGWRPVENFHHGYVALAWGTQMFPPQPLLHALKHIVKHVITHDGSVCHFCLYWPSTLSFLMCWSTVIACTTGSTLALTLWWEGQWCHIVLTFNDIQWISCFQKLLSR